MITLSTTAGSLLCCHVSQQPNHHLFRRSKTTPQDETPQVQCHALSLTAQATFSPLDVGGSPVSFAPTRPVAPKGFLKSRRLCSHHLLSTLSKPLSESFHNQHFLRPPQTVLQHNQSCFQDQTQAQPPCGMRWTHEIFLSHVACSVSSQEHTVLCTR